MMYICIHNYVIIGSDNGLVPSHYLNQCWNIINWTLVNKIQWNFPQNATISWKKMAAISPEIFLTKFYLKMTSAKCQPFCINLSASKIDELMQERHNSIANALQLCLSCTNSSICQYLSSLPVLPGRGGSPTPPESRMSPWPHRPIRTHPAAHSDI